MQIEFEPNGYTIFLDGRPRGCVEQLPNGRYVAYMDGIFDGHSYETLEEIEDRIKGYYKEQ